MARVALRLIGAEVGLVLLAVFLLLVVCIGTDVVVGMVDIAG